MSGFVIRAENFGVFIGKGSLKRPAAYVQSDAKRAKVFKTRGEAQRYAADFVIPYADKRHGKWSVIPVVDYAKNPRDPDGPTFTQWRQMIVDTVWRKALPYTPREIYRAARLADYEKGLTVLNIIDRLDEKRLGKSASVTGSKNPRPRKDTRYFQFVNTIEYGGEKAVINSWSHNSAVRPSMMRQRREWAAKYPRAKVRTERMADADIVALVAKDKHHLRSLPREIGEASLADEGPSKGHGARLAAKKKRIAKKASVTGNKNPRGPYIVRAHHENGTVYYLTSANKLSTEKRDAERYATAKEVEGILNYLELRLPKTIKYADGVKA